MKPFSRNMESLNIYTISMYYTWSNSGFTHTNPRRPEKDIVWLGDSLEILQGFPKTVRIDLGSDLRRIQIGEVPLTPSP